MWWALNPPKSRLGGSFRGALGGGTSSSEVSEELARSNEWHSFLYQSWVDHSQSIKT